MNRLIIIVSFLFFAGYGYGQISLGGGLETNFTSTGLKAQAKIGVNEKFSGQVSFAYFVNNSNPSMLNFDVHYLLTTAGDSDAITISGLGGLNYWSSGITGVSAELGINIGANITFPITDKLDMFIEPKVTAINTGDFFLALGVYF